MRKIWWSWDLRMRWEHGFSHTEDSFVRNYRQAIDAARDYGVGAIIVWGFLRDRHGGVSAAADICDYAAKRSIAILPGVGIDAYGGVYYEGTSRYSLDTFLHKHPECQAKNANGEPFSFRWPANDDTARLVACPSHAELAEFYLASLDWLMDTFALQGFQIEQGDIGLCQCEACRRKTRTSTHESISSYPSCLEDFSRRLPPIVKSALRKKADMTIVVEPYGGFTPEDVDLVRPFLKDFPEEVYHTWLGYDGPYSNNSYAGKMYISERSRLPTKHGCIALRTNNDLFEGEIDDRANIKKTLDLARKAGLEMTYIYGEYPDSWPRTRSNYEAWAQNS